MLEHVITFVLGLRLFFTTFAFGGMVYLWWDSVRDRRNLRATGNITQLEEVLLAGQVKLFQLLTVTTFGLYCVGWISFFTEWVDWTIVRRLVANSILTLNAVVLLAIALVMVRNRRELIRIAREGT